MHADDVGSSRIATLMISSFNRRLLFPTRLFVRLSGFFIGCVVFYFQIILVPPNALTSGIYLWLIFYAVFIISLEITRRKMTKYYDIWWSKSIRILLNLVFVTWLIQVSQDFRGVYGFFYIIPITAASIYFSDKNWVVIFTLSCGVIGLYLGGIILADENPLTTGQFMFITIALVLSSYYVRRFYITAISQSTDMADLNKKLLKNSDVQYLLDEIADTSIELSGAERALVVIVDPVQRKFISQYISHVSRGYKLQDNHSIEELVNRMFISKNDLIIENPNLINDLQDPSIYQELFNCKINSMLVEPLYNRENKVLGIIQISHSTPNRFDVITHNLLHQYSNFVSTAIENCFIYRKAQITEMRDSALNRKFWDITKEEQVITLVLEETQNIIPSGDGVVIHKFEPSTEHLEPISGLQSGELLPWKSSFIDPEFLGKSKMRIGVGIAGHTILLHESILVNNADEHPWYVTTANKTLLKSLLCVPLIDPSTNEPIGVISVNSNKVAAFSTNDEFKLFSIAQQASKVISQIRSFKSWREHGGTLKGIFDEAFFIDVEVNETELYERIIQSAVKLLGFRIARLRMIDRATNELVTVAIAGVPESVASELKKISIPLRELEPFLTDKYVAERSFLIPNDDEDWKKIADKYFYIPTESMEKQIGWRAYDALLVPLKTQRGRIMGLLTLDLPYAGTMPTPQNIEYVGVFASSAARTIELMSALRHVKDHEDQIFKLAISISARLGKSQDVNAISEVVVQTGVNIFAAEGCSFYQVLGKNIELTNSNFLVDTHFIGRKKPISDKERYGLTAWVAATGEPLFYNDEEYKKHPAWAGETEHIEHLNSKLVRSLMIVPVKSNFTGSTIAVITLENKLIDGNIRSFDYKDFQKLCDFAQEIGGSMDILERYKAIEKYERKGLDDDLHELMNWYHNGVVLYIDTLLDTVEKKDILDVKDDLSIICHRAYTVANELKTIHTSITSHYLEVESIETSLRLMADAWIERVSRAKRRLPILIECPENINLPISLKNPLLRIASGAVANSIKHSGVLDKPDGNILIRVKQKNNKVSLEVIDNGNGAHEFHEGYGIGRMRQLVKQLDDSGIRTRLGIKTKVGSGSNISVWATWA